MDTILIQQIKVDTIIGTKSHERTQQQAVIVDLAITTDFSKAAATDNLEYAVDYEKLCQHVKLFITNSQFYLLETLAEQIAKFILAEFKVQHVKVHIHKPQAMLEQVSVIVERSLTA